MSTYDDFYKKLEDARIQAELDFASAEADNYEVGKAHAFGFKLAMEHALQLYTQHREATAG